MPPDTALPNLAVAEDDAVAPRAAGRHARALLQAGSILALLAVFCCFAVTATGFLGAGNLANVVGQVAVVGVLALGLTFVVVGGGNDIVRGGIDLSVANNLGLCAAVYAVVLGEWGSDAGALAATLATGLLVGAVNAVSVVWLGILPLLATLAVMNVCAGLELVLTHNTVVAAASPLLTIVAGEYPAGVPVLGYGLLAVAAVSFVLLHLTPAGLRLYAVGGHREAARAAGLPVDAYVAASYLASGACAAVAAVLSVALLSGSTTGSGDMLLSVVATALLGGLAVGAFNAALIAGLGITPFLATLGTLFIGQSVQQLSTSGGQPIYLITGHVPEAFSFIGHGAVLGVPFTLLVVAVCAALLAVVMGRSRFGRRVVALGAQPAVAWYSGLRVSRDTAVVYLLSGGVCAIVGILLSCTVRAYVPLSGNAYLLNAIGATFIGTTFSAAGRPNVAGTLLGVLLLSVVANGLLLIGWNFYWQQVGTGILIFLVLVVSFGGRRLGTARAG